MSTDEFAGLRIGDRIKLGTVVCVLDDVDGRAIVTLRDEGCHKKILQRVAGTHEIVTHHM